MPPHSKSPSTVESMETCLPSAEAAATTTEYNSERDASTVLTPNTCHKVGQYARRISMEMTSYSRIVDEKNFENVPKFDRDEVILGDKLGSGGFNDVYELHKIELLEDPTKSLFHDRILSPKQQEGRALVAKKTRRGAKYAVKLLSEKTMTNAENYANGAADIMMEAKYLGSLAQHPHENIIRLHAIAAAQHDGFAQGIEGGFFLIIDQLSDTLDKKLLVWKELEKRMLEQCKVNPEAKKPYLRALFCKALQAGLEISSALTHLHRLNIIFRDLKPENIGIGYDGRVKLFDFGLAKELDPRQKHDGGDTYVMSGATGSRRYMAPEVSLKQPYNLSADVYSFSLVLWELLSLQKVFGHLSVEAHTKRVVHDQERPRISNRWSPQLQSLLKYCWAHDMRDRPTMKNVYISLQKEVDRAEALLQKSSSAIHQERPVRKELQSAPINRRGSM